jgi:DNA-binding NarL/FixJ family response regulator
MVSYQYPKSRYKIPDHHSHITFRRPIQLIIADDHEMLRQGFHNMLRRLKHIELIGEAADGQELVDLCIQLQPDVIVTDIQMPRLNGVEATREILKILPTTRIIALTLFHEDHLVVDMLEAGAKGYLLKHTNKEEIVEAIETVADNRNYYCAHTTQQLAHLIATSQYIPHRRKSIPSFSEKELQVINLLCRELSNKEIADKMQLSSRTVESYREVIFDKMEVRNVAGLVVFAIKQGMFRV